MISVLLIVLFLTQDKALWNKFARLHYYIKRHRFKRCLFALFNCVRCYFFLRVSNNAAPAKVITAKPAIGAKSPVFAVFAFGVVDSCPVCVPSA